MNEPKWEKLYFRHFQDIFDILNDRCIKTKRYFPLGYMKINLFPLGTTIKTMTVNRPKGEKSKHAMVKFPAFVLTFLTSVVTLFFFTPLFYNIGEKKSS